MKVFVSRLKRFALLFVCGPTMLLCFEDYRLRAPKLAALHGAALLAYGASVVASLLLWGGLVVAIAQMRSGTRRAILAVASMAVASLLVGNQLYAFQRYHAYLDAKAVLVGTSMLPSVTQQLATDLPGLARATLPAVLALLGFTLLYARSAGSTGAPKSHQARRALDVSVLAIVTAMLVSPQRAAVQGLLPDVMYLSAFGQLARAYWGHNETALRVHPGARTPRAVRAIANHTSPQGRSVLFVLNESVRAASSCTAYDPACVFTPFSNIAAKDRLPLLQMRTLDSTTAISLSVMWSGLVPSATRERAHEAPLLWEYAQAAGLETGYWTSQNMLFGNSGLWLQATHFTKSVHAAELEDSPSLETGAEDAAVVQRALSDIQQMKQPFVGVVHLSNTHFPYRIDEADAPFQPQGTDASPAHQVEIRNRYHDAIYHQDRSIAKLIEGIAASAPDTVIVYTSDHGEQMFEKGSHSHTSTLFEPEVHVPAWIYARPGLLSNSEVAALTALRETPVTSLDVLPTLLDVVGLWKHPSLADSMGPDRMEGESLLRTQHAPSRPIVMSNCNGLWACAFRNWGAIEGSRKLFATQADTRWMCFDVVSDPEERTPLALQACEDLRLRAEQLGKPF
jgi:glucan phosphoethanolaminetransferase (alkaline phosphatase superfamily)